MVRCKLLYFSLLVLTILLACPGYVSAKNDLLSPMAYGLEHCISGKQRFYVLQHLHQEAVKDKCGVDYTGIDTINIEIPRDAKSLPLTDYTNFGGVVINVKNHTKRFTLFKMKQKEEPCDLTWSDVIKGQIHENAQDFLIMIEDQEPWVKNRRGFNYGHRRKDILLVKNGRIQNKVVKSYGTICSQPKFTRCDIGENVKVIKNLTINRDTASTYKTNVFSIENQNEVVIQNITINTPSAKSFYGDAAIKITNCTNVRMKDVTINGTYSQKRKYGYGISMNNVWNVSFDHLVGHGNWGVFGNNNVNTATLVNCDINRFDIHCYGKDINFKNCTFRNLYNQFSSVYGKVTFENCRFDHSIPVLLGVTYNTYTGFDLCFKDCEWQVRKNRPYLIQGGNPWGPENERMELREKCWPNLFVKNMRVVVPENQKEIYLYGCRNITTTSAKIGYVSTALTENIKFETTNGQKKGTKLYLSNERVLFKNQIKTKALIK